MVLWLNVLWRLLNLQETNVLKCLVDHNVFPTFCLSFFDLQFQYAKQIDTPATIPLAYIPQWSITVYIYPIDY